MAIRPLWSIYRLGGRPLVLRLASVLVVMAAVSCGRDGSPRDAGPDSGGDLDTDSDIDGDSDTDVDTDTDSDADADSDADTDTETSTGATYAAVAVSGGAFHTCAIVENDSSKCWGNGQMGCLGYGTGVEAPYCDVTALPFVDVGGPVKDISAGGNFSCALYETSDVICWGYYGTGQIGQTGSINQNIGEYDVPSDYQPIELGGPAKQVSTSRITGEQGGHACALLENGEIECWGRNDYGQLGDAGETGQFAVVEIGGPAKQVATGYYHTCALLQSGGVVCWGYGQDGALGNGNPDTVGDDELPSDVGPSSLGGAAVSIAAGGRHTCAVMEDGGVRCWGEGGSGALGLGDTYSVGAYETPDSVEPIAVGGTATKVVAGAEHSCALLESGQVVCWGSISGGALGYGNQEIIGDDEHPAEAGPIEVGESVKDIDSGKSHICVITATDALRCWGTSSSCQLGYGDGENIGDDEVPADIGNVPLM